MRRGGPAAQPISSRWAAVPSRRSPVSSTTDAASVKAGLPFTETLRQGRRRRVVNARIAGTTGVKDQRNPAALGSWQRIRGHAILLLPGLSRIVDPKIEQIPSIRKLNMGPLVGRVPLTAPDDLGKAIFRVPRGDLLVEYMPVAADCADVLEEAPAVVDNAAAHRRAGINLATLVLEAFRSPDIIGRVREGPYPRIQDLLRLIGDAPMAADPAGDMRISMCDRSDGIAMVRLDDLSPRPEGRPASAAP